MRCYIDTDTFLILVWDDDRMSKEVARILDDYETQIYISPESVKEVINLFQCGAVKVKQWKKAEDIIKFIDEMNIEIRPVKREHLLTLAKLPIYGDHRDPFDRMIMAHAITEDIPLISSDTKFSRYKKYGLDLILNEY